MQITLTIPDHIVSALQLAFGGDLHRAVLEGFVVEGYRSGKISRYHVQTILRFDNRWDTENWLGDRGARLNYSLQDLHADRCTLDRILDR